MVLKAELKITLDCQKEFDEFKKEFREQVIESGLDLPLQQSVIELKEELKITVNSQVSDNQNSANPVDPNLPANNELPLSKSADDLLTYLAEIDPTKHKPRETYNTVDGSGVLTAQYSKNVQGPNRIDVRIPISPEDTIEDHHSRALKAFRESAFAIPNSKGEFDYFMNAGEDLDDVTKIDCSTITGTTDIEPNKGMSPARRFELDKNNKGFATWTIKQDFVERIRRGKTNFVNVTPLVKAVQDGDLEEASRLAADFPTNEITKNIKEKVDDLSTDGDVPLSLEAYLNIIKLINNLNIKKIVKPTAVTYRLISSYGSLTDASNKKFLDQLKSNMALWAISSADKWFSELVKIAKKLISKFEG